MPPSFPPQSIKSQNGEKNMKIKREIPPVVTLVTSEESSSDEEDEKTIWYFELVLH